MQEIIEFATDVATICVFDPERLKHRLSDVADWWTIDSQALEEINKGNAILLDVFSDGYYSIYIHDGPVSSKDRAIEARINCPTGNLYIGPGEMVTGEGLEPDPELGGSMISIKSGNYLLTIANQGIHKIEIGIVTISNDYTNNFSELPKLST